MVEDTLNERQRQPLDETVTAEAWEAALDEFANSPAFGHSASLADDSRDEIYREREDSQR